MKHKIKVHQTEVLDDEFFDYFKCVESIEDSFEIEFSCGDGLFYSDLLSDYVLFDNENQDENLDFYDGKVDITLFRDKDDNLHKNSYLSFDYNDKEDIWEERDRYSNFKITKR